MSRAKRAGTTKKEEWNGHEWESCDVDRISMDAAARLEKLLNE
uniref:Uncharacterized protein n=1 Tax=Siphoviridae sp. ctKNZ79 TaxID=2825440 RepID=A0A8S5U9K7_9CAUD|nr:MAG TPA: hypothetical protein [Siphoviridae sp. ctKNZ79]